MLTPKSPAPYADIGRGLGTLQGNWTDLTSYPHMRDYEAAQFAAEYLIRNDDFLAECSELTSPAAGTGELIGSTDFAARWGARFHNFR